MSRSMTHPGHPAALHATERPAATPPASAYPAWVRTEQVGVFPYPRLNDSIESADARRVREAVGLVIGDDPLMKQAWLHTQLAAKGSGTVMVRGETGTGKEVICTAIHRIRNHSKPMISINCATLNELAASTLFGHKKGAFTGAHQDHKGIFELAHGGTVFLDEVSEMSPAIQSMLLRTLETNEVWPLGAEKPVHFEQTKVIAASNKPLEERIAQGRFQEDLYYRLATHQITLPPVRARTRAHRIELIGRLLMSKKSDASMTADTLEQLLALPLKGNVRELTHVLDRALDTLQEGEVLIMPHHLPPKSPETGLAFNGGLLMHEQSGSPVLHASIDPTLAPGNAMQILDSIRNRLIAMSMDRHRGNVEVVADEIGISRSTLYRIIRGAQE